MTVSPFTFYRGAAKVMASDLSATPTAGLTVQLCGDAHLSNFGAFASPERKLLFDLNDFDETLPGPFEYDVKRMAASFTIAARNNGLTTAEGKAAAQAAVRSYRTAMAEFAEMRVMDLWYTQLSEDDLRAALLNMSSRKPAKTPDKLDKAAKLDKKAGGKDKKAEKGAKLTKPDKSAEAKAIKTAEKNLAKAHTRDSLQALSKLGELVGGSYRIVSLPPLVIPGRELGSSFGLSHEEVIKTVHAQFRKYRTTLQDDRRHLLERFEIVDVARKVVGVGSVGTRAFIVLLQGRDQQDPLFLQVKEATRSVLEDHLPKSKYTNPGERVVQGQRVMQAASDIYLGWTKGVQDDRYFYWRQLRDMKASAIVEAMSAVVLTFYAELCGWTLARAHARSGDPAAIAAYLGEDEAFDQSIADFSVRYADQNEQDYQALTDAIRSGRIQSVDGI